MIVPVFLMVPLINYVVDPANLFRQGSGVEQGIASHNLAGWNVAVPLTYADYDERVMHASIIDGMKNAHDVIVLGSSRVRQITREMFQSKSFYNFASAAATLEDFWIYYSLYRQKGFRPMRVVLGMEHWMLDGDPGYTHWKSLATVYYDAVKERGFPVPDDYEEIEARYSLERWGQLLSPAYFQASVKKLFSQEGLLSEKRFYPTRDEKAKKGEWLQRFDGSAGERQVPRTTEEVLQMVMTKDDGVSPLTEIDSIRVKLLDDLIGLMKADGAEVIICLPPVHPVTYSKWKKSKKGAVRAERFYQQYAQSKGIKLIGSYNPENTGADGSGFMDWVHPRRFVMAEIFKEAL